MGQIVFTIKEVSIQIELTYSHFTDKVTGSTPSLSQKNAGFHRSSQENSSDS